jgi:hypothetical protein
MSQTRPDACSPQTLSELQGVFDAIWDQLERERSRLTFPWAIEASRFAIARLVLEHLDTSQNRDGIKEVVLQELARGGG